MGPVAVSARTQVRMPGGRLNCRRGCGRGCPHRYRDRTLPVFDPSRLLESREKLSLVSLDKLPIRYRPRHGPLGVTAPIRRTFRILKVGLLGFGSLGLPAQDRADQRVTFNLAIAITQLTKMARLRRHRHPSLRLNAPRPSQIAEVVQPVARAAGVPVDEGDRKPGLEDRVEWPRIAMDDALATPGQFMRGGRIVQTSQHLAPGRVRAGCTPAGMVGGPAGNEGEHVPAVIIDAQEARRMFIANGFQIGQHPDGEACAVTCSTDRLTDPDHLTSDMPTRQRNLGHDKTVAGHTHLARATSGPQAPNQKSTSIDAPVAATERNKNSNSSSASWTPSRFTSARQAGTDPGHQACDHPPGRQASADAAGTPGKPPACPATVEAGDTVAAFRAGSKVTVREREG
jgi:hypothetical protein